MTQRRSRPIRQKIKKRQPPRRAAVGRPLEHAEQVRVVNWLRGRGHYVVAIPNGADVKPSQRRKLVEEGLVAGFPDLMAIRTSASCRSCCACMTVFVEMKRTGGKPSDVTDKQLQAHHALGQLGYHTIVGWGYVDACTKLTDLGF